MRIAAILALLPLPVIADTFVVQAPPVAATVYAQGALVSRNASLQLPVGQHTLELRDMDPSLSLDAMNIRLNGATITSRSWTARPDGPYRAPRTPEWMAAKAVLDTSTEALALLDDKITLALASAQAAQDQIDFLNGLTVPEDTATDVDMLRAIGQLIASDGTAARAAMRGAEVEVRKLQRERPDLEFAVAQAQAALDAVTPTNNAPATLALNVSVPQPVEATLDLSYITGGVSWAPTYAFDLVDETSLSIVRSAVISQFTNEDWTDIQLTLSTLEPFAQSEPSQLRPQLRRIEDPVTQKRELLRIQSDSPRAVAEPVIESPVMVQEAAATANFEGIGVAYTLPAPVTIRAQSEEFEIALDTLSMDATLSARAIPLFDDTAFRLASVTNTSTEILLPGRALLFVDGQLVGNTQVRVLPPNADADIFFGRIDGLRLTRTVLDRNEGDRGIITRSNEETEEVQIEVENLTNRSWDVTVRDVVPFSEQEDLVIDWSASPAPDIDAVDDQRGILEWQLSVPAGVTQSISINTKLTWPEGKVLR
ncbi:hypothetical protein GCM10007385_05110 [Tateyamaria omphalii]|uniref:DUF4139 domain-containing protein n=1 Tax=Tateyamaria omphalii TaxID=299262 RepID=UPI00167C42E4|nr:DUF4139 domain-containing protein [Tateyamaria omphalii]GGX40675.1 hypothetical protein GCM10007385_05110 [Tateyamaria omphalii]